MTYSLIKREFMKKLCALIMILIFTDTAYGQMAPSSPPPPPPPIFVPQYYPLLHPGIIFTPLISWYSVINNPGDPNRSYAANNGAHGGFTIGATFNQMFTPNYGIEVDPEYELSGGDITHSYNYNGTNYSIDYNLHLQYLDLPVAFKFETNAIGYEKYFLRIGGTPKLSVGNRADVDTSIAGGPKHPTVDNVLVRQEITPINLMLFIGGGFEYNLAGNTSLLVGLNYEAGVVNVWRVSSDNLNIKNHILSLNLGILF